MILKYILEYLNIKYINMSHLRQTLQSVEEDFKLLAYYTNSQLFLGFCFLKFVLVMSLTFLLRIKFQRVISNFIFVCVLFLHINLFTIKWILNCETEKHVL